MVKSALLMQGARVQSLVEELRSHMPHVETKKKKKMGMGLREARKGEEERSDILDRFPIPPLPHLPS